MLYPRLRCTTLHSKDLAAWDGEDTAMPLHWAAGEVIIIIMMIIIIVIIIVIIVIVIVIMKIIILVVVVVVVLLLLLGLPRGRADLSLERDRRAQPLMGSLQVCCFYLRIGEETCPGTEKGSNACCRRNNNNNSNSNSK